MQKNSNKAKASDAKKNQIKLKLQMRKNSNKAEC